jgi:hypothetical protein
VKSIPFETFCSDPQLVGEAISKPWSVFYRAIEGLPLNAEETEIFCACSGRETYEPRVYNEATALAGRRSEKTSTGLKYMLWKLLTTPEWLKKHRGTIRIPIVAQDMRIAKDIKKTAQDLVLNSPLLKNEVAEVLATEIQFRNGICLTVYPATWSSTRGLSCPAGFLDELAFVTIDGGSDVELVRQIKPTMLRYGALRRLLKLTTPWQKSGLVYDEFSHRNERPDLLVWQASTAFMTPRVAAELLEKERTSDPTYFAREYEAIFTDDLECFIPAADVDMAIRKGVRERPFVPELKQAYVAAIDASSLTGRDRFVFGIAHPAICGSAGRGTTIDVLRGWTRSTVNQTCDEIAALAKSFEIRTITADQHGYAFLRELMAQRGIALKQLPFTSRSKPEIFIGMKIAFAQARVQLLDHPEAARELRALESKRTSGGHYQIAAPRSLHDDFATCCGLLIHELKDSNTSPGFLLVSDGPGRPPREVSANGPITDWRDPRFYRGRTHF